MRNTKFKTATAVIALSVGILGSMLPLAVEAAPQPPQCNAVTGCGTLLDYIKNLVLKA